MGLGSSLELSQFLRRAPQKRLWSEAGSLDRIHWSLQGSKDEDCSVQGKDIFKARGKNVEVPLNNGIHILEIHLH